MIPKPTLRKQAQARRAEAQAAAGPGAGEALAGHAMALLRGRPAGTVSAFHPFGSEIDCLPLLARLEAAGWRLALPVVGARAAPLTFRAWRIGAPLVTDAYGIAVPEDTAPEVEPDVLLVPLLAFDREGYRLGYGGGYYDRTLERLRARRARPAVGLAFAAQEVAHCPREAFDQPLDAVVTEAGVIEIAPLPQAAGAAP